MEALTSVSAVILIFTILNVFHISQSTKNTLLLKNDNYLAVHEEPEHINRILHGRGCKTGLSNPRASGGGSGPERVFFMDGLV